MYMPLPEDLLRVHVRTTGVACHKLYKHGRQAERHKWLALPDNCQSRSTIFFVASLVDFAHTLAEEKETNRMIDSLKLYEQTCKQLDSQGVAHCLFLTHGDVMRRYLQSSAMATTI